MNWFLLTVSVLSCYSISLMVSKLSGPGRIFARLRGAAKGTVKDGLSCPICSGTWIAALLVSYLCWLGYFPWTLWPVLVFSVSGGNALLHLFDPV